MLKRTLAATIAAMALCISSYAQNQVKAEFQAAADSLTTLLQERTTVYSKLRIDKVVKNGSGMDVYFKATLGDFPWHEDDVTWFKDELSQLVGENYKVGAIYCVRQPLSSYIVPELSFNGQPRAYKHSFQDPGDFRFVRRIGAREFRKGLSGRNIVLWQSHGSYYESANSRWQFQRAPVHRTVEDMYTQSYVIPFLIPMLENAGAYVMTPRERDIQLNEVIIDNDPAFQGAREGLMRRTGEYSETGKWTDAGEGFADRQRSYAAGENPFRMGTARQISAPAGTAKWIPYIPERGQYAVYVSYKSVEGSTKEARYTVHHMGGDTEFTVNQNVGGGTWIYLGTFEFEEGRKGYVTLSGQEGILTADAVKIGGGMGKMTRGGRTSGLPSYAEGALYWEQWAGADTTLTEEWGNEYTKEYAGRGAWATMMQEEKNIKYNLSLAFHSDAGVTPNDSIVGTLAIYTLKNDGKDKLPDGHSRITGRLLADFVQTQVVNDIRSGFEPEWSRRETWDKSYSECRTTSVPGMILELLSHQNLADMKYGEDPAFRFTVSRAVYKGMLKFLSTLYDKDYIVQPLPVNSFAAQLKGNSAELSWKATKDTLESTATTDGYVVYTRIDGGAFDSGKNVKDNSISLNVTPGHIYSFKVVAYNGGGYSFPSEILSVGIPSGKSKGNVFVVNDFDRVSAPAWLDTPTYAGFDSRQDSGVPYITDLTFIGENYEFDRSAEWVEDDNAGWGASYTDRAGQKVAGNTFDYPYMHGQSILAAGFSFSSSSRDAWCAKPSLSDGSMALDLICGKQLTTAMGRGAVPDRYEVFPAALQERIRAYTTAGGDVLVSGANIGTDVWETVYPVKVDTLARDAAQSFVKEVFGYRYLTGHASRLGQVEPFNGGGWTFRSVKEPFQYQSTPCPEIYCVENPDGIVPVSKKAFSTLRYSGSNVSAATAFNQGKYKAVSIGFPLETVKDKSVRDALIADALSWFVQ